MDFDDIDGVVALGGSMAPSDSGAAPWLEAQMDALRRAHVGGLPVVGIGLGAQVLAVALGGKVESGATPQVGWSCVRLAFAGTTDPIFGGIRSESIQFHRRRQQISEPPGGAAVLAGSEHCRVEAFKVGFRTYGIQYHFEWTQAHLERVCRAPFVAEAGFVAEKILGEAPNYEESYLRLGRRLAQNIVTLLFPFDKR